jgi:Flp pilus assembly protein TadB
VVVAPATLQWLGVQDGGAERSAVRRCTAVNHWLVLVLAVLLPLWALDKLKHQSRKVHAARQRGQASQRQQQARSYQQQARSRAAAERNSPAEAEEAELGGGVNDPLCTLWLGSCCAWLAADVLAALTT